MMERSRLDVEEPGDLLLIVVREGNAFQATASQEDIARIELVLGRSLCFRPVHNVEQLRPQPEENDGFTAVLDDPVGH